MNAPVRATARGRRLRVLTCHVDGNYLYYLSRKPPVIYLVTQAPPSVHHFGRSGLLPCGDNVHEAPTSLLIEKQRGAAAAEPCT